MDFRPSPQRIGDAHLADQPANVQRHSRSAAAANVDFQRQYDPKPARCQRITVSGRTIASASYILGKQSADTSQYQSVNRDEGRSFGTGSPQHVDLLPQDQNFCLKRNSRPQQIDHHSQRSVCTNLTSSSSIARFLINRQPDGVCDRDSRCDPVEDPEQLPADPSPSLTSELRIGTTLVLEAEDSTRNL